MSATTRRAYESVQEGIAAGELPAGSWLREPVVAARLGISRTPVREALRMLAAEGAVELVHNRGARVVRWSAEDIDEVYRLRGLLEGHGAALAARSATPEQVDHVRSCQRRYEEALREGPDSARSAACNDDFHAAVMTAAGSPRLAALLGTISSAPLVARALRQYGEDDRRRSVLQHRDILLALTRRDEDLAEAAMRSHILAARYAAVRVADDAGAS